jgi:chromosome segregation ATPase
MAYLNKLQECDQNYYKLKQSYDEVCISFKDFKYKNNTQKNENITLINDLNKLRDDFQILSTENAKLKEDNINMFKKLKSKDELLEQFNSSLEKLKQELKQREYEIEDMQNDRKLLMEDNTKLHSELGASKNQISILKDHNIRLCSELEKVIEGDKELDYKLRAYTSY